MQSFSQFLRTKNSYSLAESIVRSGIDSEFFCESVIRNARKVDPQSSYAVDQIAEGVYNEILGGLLGGIRNVLGKSYDQSTFGTKTAGKAMDLAKQAGSYLADKGRQAGQYVSDKAGQAAAAVGKSMQDIGDNYMQGQQIAELKKTQQQIASMKEKLTTILGRYGVAQGFTKNLHLQVDSLVKKLEEIIQQVQSDASLRATPGGVQPAQGTFGPRQ